MIFSDIGEAFAYQFCISTEIQPSFPTAYIFRIFIGWYKQKRRRRNTNSIMMNYNKMEYAFIFLVICLQSGNGFKCLQCNEILTQNSDCKLIPSNVSVEVECTTFCYTKIHMAAGLEIEVDRGCTQDEDCDELDSCISITKTGLCSNCCRQDNCNHGYPVGVVTSNTVAWNGNLFIILSIIIAKMTDS